VKEHVHVSKERAHVLAVTLQRQHVGVEWDQGGAVAHRHHPDASRDAPPQAVLLQLHVQGTGALVDDGEGGGVTEQPGEGQALLLPQGQGVGPVLHSLQATGSLQQVAQTDLA
jgi:hypothetical protein